MWLKNVAIPDNFDFYDTALNRTTPMLAKPKKKKKIGRKVYTFGKKFGF